MIINPDKVIYDPEWLDHTIEVGDTVLVSTAPWYAIHESLKSSSLMHDDERLPKVAGREVEVMSMGRWHWGWDNHVDVKIPGSDRADCSYRVVPVHLACVTKVETQAERQERLYQEGRTFLRQATERWPSGTVLRQINGKGVWEILDDGKVWCRKDPSGFDNGSVFGVEFANPSIEVEKVCHLEPGKVIADPREFLADVIDKALLDWWAVTEEDIDSRNDYEFVADAILSRFNVSKKEQAR